MKKINLIIITVSLILAGCASIKPQHFTGPNMKDAYIMQCSGMGRTWHKCYQKASEICSTGYNIIAKDSELYSTEYGLANKRDLTIECK
jgi:hypothetical protein